MYKGLTRNELAHKFNFFFSLRCLLTENYGFFCEEKEKLPFLKKILIFSDSFGEANEDKITGHSILKPDLKTVQIMKPWFRKPNFYLLV